MKVFEMNDYDWMLANSKEEALEAYAMDGDPVDDGEVPRELDSDELHSLKVCYDWVDEDGSEQRETRSFYDELNARISDGVKKPELFCATEM